MSLKRDNDYMDSFDVERQKRKELDKRIKKLKQTKIKPRQPNSGQN